MIDGTMTPVVYALLPGESQFVSTRFFTLLKEHMSRLNLSFTPTRAFAKLNKYAKFILKLNKYAKFILKLNKYAKFILKLNKYNILIYFNIYVNDFSPNVNFLKITYGIYCCFSNYNLLS
jgi:hypothetical protein